MPTNPVLDPAKAIGKEQRGSHWYYEFACINCGRSIFVQDSYRLKEHSGRCRRCIGKAWSTVRRARLIANLKSLGEVTSRPPGSLCECGCGLPAPLATRFEPREGYLEGEAKRFIRAHMFNGTQVSGERSGMSRLTDKQRREIVRQLEQGARMVDLAARYGVDATTIRYTGRKVYPNLLTKRGGRGRLTPEQVASVFILRDVEHLSLAEISRRLGVYPSYAHQIYNRKVYKKFGATPTAIRDIVSEYYAGLNPLQIALKLKLPVENVVFVTNSLENRRKQRDVNRKSNTSVTGAPPQGGRDAVHQGSRRKS